MGGPGLGSQALPSPVVRVGQLEPRPGQLDVLLTDHEGEDLLVGQMAVGLCPKLKELPQGHPQGPVGSRGRRGVRALPCPAWGPTPPPPGLHFHSHRTCDPSTFLAALDSARPRGGGTPSPDVALAALVHHHEGPMQLPKELGRRPAQRDPQALRGQVVVLLGGGPERGQAGRGPPPPPALMEGSPTL